MLIHSSAVYYTLTAISPRVAMSHFQNLNLPLSFACQAALLYSWVLKATSPWACLISLDNQIDLKFVVEANLTPHWSIFVLLICSPRNFQQKAAEKTAAQLTHTQKIETERITAQENLWKCVLISDFSAWTHGDVQHSVVNSIQTLLRHAV